eukprot:2757778-Amphidinium_carterae.1
MIRSTFDNERHLDGQCDTGQLKKVEGMLTKSAQGFLKLVSEESSPKMLEIAVFSGDFGGLNMFGFFVVRLKIPEIRA